ncbi:GntR family transcriptional regulator [Paenibacillus thermotolerans]|uniref:GntR family transcriptional regulator n=1 Tax=Paenibacillus thermotolerans TaxID=3027807 RepID=UPI002368E6DF|nr:MULTISPECIES: GntR family transcriptional regulator [unclassified Paenibacillus]
MDKTEKTPLYQYIIDDIKGKIAREELQPGDPLPTQIDLAKMYNISEITSRRALSELVKEGYIYRIRGKGSFIKEKKPQLDDDVSIRTIYFVHNQISIDKFNFRFWNDMLEGIKEVCEENGVDFYLWDSGDSDRLPDDPNAAFILNTRPDFHLKTLETWRNEGRRIVTVHFYYPYLHIPYVIVDNLTGGYLATQHLISLGHQRIGIILTGKSLIDLNQEFSLRLQGYRLALQQHRIPFESELVCVMDGSSESTEMGYEGFKKLFSADRPPTAVFATSDYKAIGAMQAAREMGLSVPEDVSLVGYDDMPVSQYTHPNLTTINQNSMRMGRRAAEILLHELPGKPQSLVKDEIVPKLVIRDSTSELQGD